MLKLARISPAPTSWVCIRTPEDRKQESGDRRKATAAASLTFSCLLFPVSYLLSNDPDSRKRPEDKHRLADDAVALENSPESAVVAMVAIVAHHKQFVFAQDKRFVDR